MPFLSNARALCGVAAVAAVAALAVGAGAVTANAATLQTADGTPGWYELCSNGTYASEVIEPPANGLQGFDSVIVNPGSCASIYMTGNEANIYGFYPGGSAFYIGAEWWPANIATDGNMGQFGWYVF